ncbi:hypothetical protein KCU98_g269, partial [Aureobasidium melanogenum]
MTDVALVSCWLVLVELDAGDVGETAFLLLCRLEGVWVLGLLGRCLFLGSFVRLFGYYSGSFVYLHALEGKLGGLLARFVSILITRELIRSISDDY